MTKIMTMPPEDNNSKDNFLNLPWKRNRSMKSQIFVMQERV